MAPKVRTIQDVKDADSQSRDYSINLRYDLRHKPCKNIFVVLVVTIIKRPYSFVSRASQDTQNLCAATKSTFLTYVTELKTFYFSALS